MLYLCHPDSPKREYKTQNTAEIAQLVEHDLAKVGVASSSLVFRSKGLLNAFRRLFILGNCTFFGDFLS